VHGAFVRDGTWWWAPAARLLSKRGIASTAVRLPSCGEAGARPTGAGPGLADDVAAVRAALDGGPAGGEPAIVVAHSYGGMVVSEAAAGHPGVAALAYISSFLPEPGQSLADLGTSANPVPTQRHADGSVSVLDLDLVPSRVIELPAGHHPFLSRPDLVAAAIDELSAS
jgi:pimeloyl-ACP methyl ester carboxylesterase